MSAYILTHDEILDAISRATELQDGTYTLSGSWVGSARVWMAQPVLQSSGYEVAYEEIKEGSAWYDLSEARFGVWTDPDTGEIVLDRTVNIRGNFNVVEMVADHYSQKAVWDWADGRSIDILPRVSIDDI